MSIIECVTIIVVSVVILILAIMFYKPLCKIINKFCKLKNLKKTKEGFSTEFSGEKELDFVKKEIEEQEEIVKVEQSLTEEKAEQKEIAWTDYYFSGKYEDARKMLEENLNEEKDEGKIVSYSCFVGSCIQKDDFKKGVEKIEQVIKLYPKHTMPYTWLASWYYDIKLIEEALDIIERGLNATSNKNVSPASPSKSSKAYPSSFIFLAMCIIPDGVGSATICFLPP